MEAISNAGAAVGILATDGVVLVAEKKITSKLLEASKTDWRRCPGTLQKPRISNGWLFRKCTP